MDALLNFKKADICLSLNAANHMMESYRQPFQVRKVLYKVLVDFPQ